MHGVRLQGLLAHDGRVYKYKNSNARLDAFAWDGEIEDMSDAQKAQLWATASATNGELTSILQRLDIDSLNNFIVNAPGELCLSGGLQLCSDLFGPK